MSINTHIPLKYCLGFTPFYDHFRNRKLVVKLGEKITQEMIDDYDGDASKFIVAIRPEPDLSEKIKKNTKKIEVLEEKKIERIAKKIYAGGQLFQQGEEDKNIYILMDGIVEIYLNGSLVAELSEKGSFIGELSIINNCPRSATVKAQTDCLFYSIDGSDLFVLAENHPVVLSKLCKSLANKIARTSSEISLLKMTENKSNTRVITKPLLEESRLLKNMSQLKNKIHAFDKDVNLFAEGEMSFDIYILIKGEVRVSIGGESIVRIGATGSLIGEMSSLRVKPRSATVTTVVPSEFYRIQGLRLMETCEEDPQFLVRLAHILANRLSSTSAEYAHLIKSSDF